MYFYLNETPFRDLYEYVFDNIITSLNFGLFRVMESSSTSPIVWQILQKDQKIFVYPHIFTLLFDILYCRIIWPDETKQGLHRSRYIFPICVV